MEGPHGHRELVRESDDASRIYTGAGHHLELSGHRSRGPAGDPSLHLERPERLQQRLDEPSSRASPASISSLRAAVSSSIGGMLESMAAGMP